LNRLEDFVLGIVTSTIGPFLVQSFKGLKLSLFENKT
jgi:hypothetical protein